MEFDILIIGAGAAGLLSAGKLAENGYKVALLEANTKAGGRIATVVNKDRVGHMETGAEFVHGKAELTKAILKKAKINLQPLEGETMVVNGGIVLQEDADDEHQLVVEKLNQLKEDCTIDSFLKFSFPQIEFENLRKSVRSFAEGFSLADTSKASALAFRNEWKQVEEEQYRVSGGYGTMIDYLLQQCVRYKAYIYYNAVVERIEHRRGKVKVYTRDNRLYVADKLIITVSAGVLKSGDLQFSPSLPLCDAAIQQLGFGSVIKFLYHFNSPFWEEGSKKLSILLSDEKVPTWWSQLPNHSSLLTGWLGGPKAKVATLLTRTELHQQAMESLSDVWHIDKKILEKKLVHNDIVYWNNHPHIKGGYSYTSIGSGKAKEVLQMPVNDTIYFAGEALHSGESQGTVEAALGSAQKVIADILSKR